MARSSVSASNDRGVKVRIGARDPSASSNWLPVHSGISSVPSARGSSSRTDAAGLDREAASSGPPSTKRRIRGLSCSMRRTSTRRSGGGARRIGVRAFPLEEPMRSLCHALERHRAPFSPEEGPVSEPSGRNFGAAGAVGANPGEVASAGPWRNRGTRTKGVRTGGGPAAGWHLRLRPRAVRVGLVVAAAAVAVALLAAACSSGGTDGSSSATSPSPLAPTSTSSSVPADGPRVSPSVADVVELRPLWTSEDRRIVDDLDREVLLRGANLNSLGEYWQGDPDHAPTIAVADADWDAMAPTASR